VRQLRLSLAELYQPAGRYDYERGWNARAISALIVGWIPPLIGLVYPALSFLWGAGWFFSIIVAGFAYAGFMRNDRSRLTLAEYDAITEILPPAAAAAQTSPEAAPA
jgi:NCS1 family nucleobase:cation symporter-1